MDAGGCRWVRSLVIGYRAYMQEMKGYKRIKQNSSTTHVMETPGVKPSIVCEAYCDLIVVIRYLTVHIAYYIHQFNQPILPNS